MNKSAYLLLLSISLISVLGDDGCSYYSVEKFNTCSKIRLADSSKSCVYLNNECKEQLADCSLYAGSVAAECESIIPWSPYSYKCVFKNNKCESEPINSCSDYKSGLPEEFCNYISPSNGGSCHLVSNECKLYYPECSDYKGNEKNVCESIELENPYKICSYTGNECVEKTKTGVTCKSFEAGQDEDYCYEIELENGKKYCGFYDNKCTEYFKKCSDYDGTNEKECNSNIPENYYEYKCVYKDGKCTEQKKSSCSDYKEGEDEDYCEDITLSDENKGCKLVDGQCKEVIQACDSYKGKDQKECESITPKNYYSYKCVFKGEKCQQEQKTCSDYKKGEDSYYCTGIHLSDYNNKHCTFENDECKESYRECSYYTGNDESKCKSIITQNGGRCVFEGNTCKDKVTTCSGFTSLLDEDNGQSCEKISPSDVFKKCVYSNYNCKEEDKYCTEFTSDATKEICEKAPTSSNKKKCVLSDDKKSCVEKNGANIIKAFSSLLFLLLL